MKNYWEEILDWAEDDESDLLALRGILKDLITECLHEGSLWEYRSDRKNLGDVLKEALGE